VLISLFLVFFVLYFFFIPCNRLSYTVSYRIVLVMMVMMMLTVMVMMMLVVCF